MSERLQKLMARAGMGSRRQLEAEIAAGELMLNGRAATLGDRADVGDRIQYQRKRFRVVPSEQRDVRLIAYHKPEGRVTTRSDEQRRPTVFEHLPHLRSARWIAVGRLDINTSGLLMFTDNGDLAHGLMHPSSEVEREYACRVRGPVAEDDIKKLVTGVQLEDGLARFQRCVFEGGTDNNQWFRAVLSEGRNREVRRMWDALGYTVSRLIRVRYGPVRLPGYLRAGKYADVGDAECRELCNVAGVRLRGQALKLVADKSRRSGTPRQSTRRGRAPGGRRSR